MRPGQTTAVGGGGRLADAPAGGLVDELTESGMALLELGLRAPQTPTTEGPAQRRASQLTTVPLDGWCSSSSERASERQTPKPAMART